MGIVRIFNVMFGRELGGIEQAFLDYSKCLSDAGHQVIALIHPDAAVRQPLSHLNVMVQRVSNRGQWDLFAASRLNKLVFSKYQPDIIITHGNRATSLMLKAANRKIPVVAVSHNYGLKNIKLLNAVFAITDDLYRHTLNSGLSKDRIFHIPNMIDMSLQPKNTPKPASTIPTIGAMGRLVKKKGFDVFIRALALMKKRDIAFKAVIAGSGPEEDNLKSLAVKLGVLDSIEFCGWVEKKEKFFKEIDVFCLPSHHEPFGIILLEAFLFGKAVVSTASEGPSQIIQHEVDGILTELNSAEALASGLTQLIEYPDYADKLASNGYKKIASDYAMEHVGKKISSSLENILQRDRTERRALLFNCV